MAVVVIVVVVVVVVVVGRIKIGIHQNDLMQYTFNGDNLNSDIEIKLSVCIDTF